MSLFSRVFGAKSYNISSVADWLGYRTRSGVSVSEQKALEVSAVFCAVRVIAEGIAQMPLQLKQNRGDRTAVVTDHWAHRLLSVRPNSWQTPYEFMEGLALSAALTGDFLGLKNEINGEIREIIPIVPGGWSLEQKQDYSLVYTITDNGRTIATVGQADVLHVRGPSLDFYQGCRPIRLAREAIGLSSALETQQAQIASRGGRPSGVLSTASQLSQEASDRLRAAWDAKFGVSGEGGVAVLDGGWDFSAMQMTAVDAQHLETRKHQIEEIARALRVFPQMLMHTDKTATFASAEQFFRAHVIHTLGPWMKRIQDAINRDVLRRTQLYADFDERRMLRGDFKDQGEYYAKALGAGGTPAWMTQDEVRADLGMDPKGGDADRLSRGAMNPEAGNGTEADPGGDQG